MFKPKTWMYEQAFVALVLATVVIVTRGGWIEWVGAIAVLLSFAHGSVADRLAEAEERRTVKHVECYRWARRYFLGKEMFWLIYFVAHRSWSALVGVGIFLAYPIWRQVYRRKLKPKLV